MGRNCSLYGLNYKKIKNDFAPEFDKKENLSILSTYISNFDDKSIDTYTVVSKLKNYPHLLSIDEIHVAISAYTDSWEIVEINSSYYSQRIEQMKNSGIALLFETPFTNPSNVFMEQFFETFFDLGKEGIEYRYGIYKLNSIKLLKFLNRLIAIAEFFYQKEHDSSFQLNSELNKLYSLEIEKIFKEQTMLRSTAIDEFEYDRQGFNYFSFSSYCGNFTSLKKEAELFDEFLLFDSY